MNAAMPVSGGLLAVDWGTSSFRLSGIDAAGNPISDFGYRFTERFLSPGSNFLIPRTLSS